MTVRSTALVTVADIYCASIPGPNPRTSAARKVPDAVTWPAMVGRRQSEPLFERQIAVADGGPGDQRCRMWRGKSDGRVTVWSESVSRITASPLSMYLLLTV